MEDTISTTHLLRADLRAEFFDFSPGDQTRYRFIVSQSAQGDVVEDGALFCASVLRSPRCDGYRYFIDSVHEFMDTWAPNVQVDKSRYSSSVQASGVLGDHFLRYVCEHAECKTWTALAAIQCMALYSGWRRS